MQKRLHYTLSDLLSESLQDPEFRQAWAESEAEYQLAASLIEYRRSQSLSQRALAKKVGSTQAVISRIESMSANPTLSLMKRLAKALGTSLYLSFNQPNPVRSSANSSG